MTEDESGQDPKSPQDARLTSLDERLRKAQAGEAGRTGKQAGGATPYYRSQGYRVLSVLVSYPFGSAMIGLVIDHFAQTRGIWVAMLFLGFGIAIWEVWKISKQASDTGP
jgi:ATP synthase protein I